MILYYHIGYIFKNKTKGCLITHPVRVKNNRYCGVRIYNINNPQKGNWAAMTKNRFLINTVHILDCSVTVDVGTRVLWGLSNTEEEGDHGRQSSTKI
jgi:hypothetical protein